MRDRGDFGARVQRVLRRIGPGDVATYGEIAEEAGSPGAARAVGNLLSKGGHGLPWWRVVRADGSLAARSRDEQARRLEAEGVRLHKGRVRTKP